MKTIELDILIDQLYWTKKYFVINPGIGISFRDISTDEKKRSRFKYGETSYTVKQTISEIINLLRD